MSERDGADFADEQGFADADRGIVARLDPFALCEEDRRVVSGMAVGSSSSSTTRQGWLLCSRDTAD